MRGRGGGDQAARGGAGAAGSTQNAAGKQTQPGTQQNYKYKQKGTNLVANQ